jgi:hypothetical protein
MWAGGKKACMMGKWGFLDSIGLLIMLEFP